MQPLKIAFMGTPAFAVPVLGGLLDAGHEAVAVYTQPDKPAGRGRRPAQPPVKEYALARGLPVLQPSSLRSQGVQDQLESLAPDVVVVAAYGRFLPPPVLDLPPLGCLNVHPSLLPKYRGPSPVSSAILNGEAVTGVTIIRLDEGMDSGPIVAQTEEPIGVRETAEELTARLFLLGASLLVEVLPRWARADIQARPQDDSQATVTKLLSREDGEIDWGLGAGQIARQVLAYHPWPGTFTRWSGKTLKIMEASMVVLEGEAPSPPGLVVSLADGGLGVATGDGVLAVERLQLQGRQVVSARDFVRGHPEVSGSVLS